MSLFTIDALKIPFNDIAESFSYVNCERPNNLDEKALRKLIVGDEKMLKEKVNGFEITYFEINEYVINNFDILEDPVGVLIRLEILGLCSINEIVRILQNEGKLKQLIDAIRKSSNGDAFLFEYLNPNSISILLTVIRLNNDDLYHKVLVKNSKSNRNFFRQEFSEKCLDEGKSQALHHLDPNQVYDATNNVISAFVENLSPRLIFLQILNHLKLGKLNWSFVLSVFKVLLHNPTTDVIEQTLTFLDEMLTLFQTTGSYEDFCSLIIFARNICGRDGFLSYDAWFGRKLCTGDNLHVIVQHLQKMVHFDNSRVHLKSQKNYFDKKKNDNQEQEYRAQLRKRIESLIQVSPQKKVLYPLFQRNVMTLNDILVNYQKSGSNFVQTKLNGMVKRNQSWWLESLLPELLLFRPLSDGQEQMIVNLVQELVDKALIPKDTVNKLLKREKPKDSHPEDRMNSKCIQSVSDLLSNVAYQKLSFESDDLKMHLLTARNLNQSLSKSSPPQRTDVLNLVLEIFVQTIQTNHTTIRIDSKLHAWLQCYTTIILGSFSEFHEEIVECLISNLKDNPSASTIYISTLLLCYCCIHHEQGNTQSKMYIVDEFFRKFYVAKLDEMVTLIRIASGILHHLYCNLEAQNFEISHLMIQKLKWIEGYKEFIPIRYQNYLSIYSKIRDSYHFLARFDDRMNLKDFLINEAHLVLWDADDHRFSKVHHYFQEIRSSYQNQVSFSEEIFDSFLFLPTVTDSMILAWQKIYNFPAGDGNWCLTRIREVIANPKLTVDEKTKILDRGFRIAQRMGNFYPTTHVDDLLSEGEVSEHFGNAIQFLNDMSTLFPWTPSMVSVMFHYLCHFPESLGGANKIINSCPLLCLALIRSGFENIFIQNHIEEEIQTTIEKVKRLFSLVVNPRAWPDVSSIVHVLKIYPEFISLVSIDIPLQLRVQSETYPTFRIELPKDDVKHFLDVRILNLLSEIITKRQQQRSDSFDIFLLNLFYHAFKFVIPVTHPIFLKETMYYRECFDPKCGSLLMDIVKMLFTTFPDTMFIINHDLKNDSDLKNLGKYMSEWKIGNSEKLSIPKLLQCDHTEASILILMVLFRKLISDQSKFQHWKVLMQQSPHLQKIIKHFLQQFQELCNASLKSFSIQSNCSLPSQNISPHQCQEYSRKLYQRISLEFEKLLK